MELEKVSYTPLASVTAVFPQEELGFVPQGVGVLMTEENPSEFQPSCLGILFNSSSYVNRVASPDHISLTLMYGGSKNPELIFREEFRIERKVLKDLNLVFGLKTRSVPTKISRWEKAIPVYNSQILNIQEQSKQGWCSVPGRIIFGNYTGQVSIRGMIEKLDSSIPSAK